MLTKIVQLAILTFALAQEQTEPDASDLIEEECTTTVNDAGEEVEECVEVEPELTAEEILQRQIEECRRLSCYVFTEDETAYNLTPLTKVAGDQRDDYLQPVVQGQMSLEFNFCQHLHGSHYFARMLHLGRQYDILTGVDCLPESVDEVIDQDEIVGITVVQKPSITKCKEAEGPNDEDTYFSFAFSVLCDEDITEDGAAEFLDINMDDECQPHVTYRHNAGCHAREETEVVVEGDTIIEVVKESTPLSDLILKGGLVNRVVFGGFLIALGLPVAFTGTMWFKYICGVFGGSSAAIVAAFLFEAFKLMEDDSIGLWLCLGISVVIGIVIGLILYKFYTIGSVIIGAVLGFAYGMMVWGFIAAWMTFSIAIGQLIAIGVGSVLGIFFAIKFQEKTILYGTSLLGAYTFMRGVSLILGDFAGERVMYGLFSHTDQEPERIKWLMGLYVAILYVIFTVASFVQFATGEKEYALRKVVMKQGVDRNDIHQDVGGIHDDPEEDEEEDANTYNN